MIAKVGALSAISLVVAAILAFIAGVSDLHIVLLGVVISSAIFTLLGMIIVLALMMILFVLGENCVLKMWNSMGGVKL